MTIANCCAARQSQWVYASLRCWSVTFGLIDPWHSLSIITKSTNSKFSAGSLIRRQDLELRHGVADCDAPQSSHSYRSLCCDAREPCGDELSFCQRRDRRQRFGRHCRHIRGAFGPARNALEQLRHTNKREKRVNPGLFLRKARQRG